MKRNHLLLMAVLIVRRGLLARLDRADSARRRPRRSGVVDRAHLGVRAAGQFVSRLDDRSVRRDHRHWVVSGRSRAVRLDRGQRHRCPRFGAAAAVYIYDATTFPKLAPDTARLVGVLTRYNQLDGVVTRDGSTGRFSWLRVPTASADAQPALRRLRERAHVDEARGSERVAVLRFGEIRATQELHHWTIEPVHPLAAMRFGATMMSVPPGLRTRSTSRKSSRRFGQ